jgi:hypothetical protein
LKSEGERTQEFLVKRYENTQQQLKRNFDTLKSASPDFKRLQTEYVKSLEQLGEEMLSDKSIKEAFEYL